VEDAGKGNFTVSAAVFAALNILGSVDDHKKDLCGKGCKLLGEDVVMGFVSI
jgi:hypothetical protein